jgi:hypothetical protein
MTFNRRETQAVGRPLAWAELLRAVGAGANGPRSTPSVLGLPPSALFAPLSVENIDEDIPARSLLGKAHHPPGP